MLHIMFKSASTAQVHSNKDIKVDLQIHLPPSCQR